MNGTSTALCCFLTSVKTGKRLLGLIISALYLCALPGNAQTPEIPPWLWMNEAVFHEGDGTVSIPIHLSRPAEKTVTALITTTSFGGTAEPGKDFWGLATPIEIPVGESATSVNLTILDDDIDENVVETLELSAIFVENAVTRETAAFTKMSIVDDDGADDVTLIVTGADGPFYENSGTVEITATLSNPLKETASVLVFTQPGRGIGSARPGVDYYGFTRTLVFPPMTTKQTFELVLLDNDEPGWIYAPTRSLTLRFKQAVNVTLPEYDGDDYQLRLNIYDDDYLR